MNDWLDFFASIIDSLAWPAATVVLVYILRRELRGLMATLRRFRYRDLEMEFGEQVRELREDAEQADLPPPVEDERLLRVAEVSPRALVLESYFLVSEEAAAAARRAGLDVSERDPPVRTFRALWERGLISDAVRSLLTEIRVLRNAAAHDTEFAVSTEQALEYSRLARRVAAVLRDIGGAGGLQ